MKLSVSYYPWIIPTPRACLSSPQGGQSLLTLAEEGSGIWAIFQWSFFTGPCMTRKTSFCTLFGQGFSSGTIMVALGPHGLLAYPYLFKCLPRITESLLKAGFKSTPSPALEHWSSLSPDPLLIPQKVEGFITSLFEDSLVLSLISPFFPLIFIGV